MVADIIAPKLSIIFCSLIRLGSFLKCWQSVNVSAIPNGAPTPNRENCHPISITPILSKVYEKLVSYMLSSFFKKYFFPAVQFAYKEGMHCTDALLTISHHLQKSFETGLESYIYILFSSTFVQPSIE